MKRFLSMGLIALSLISFASCTDPNAGTRVLTSEWDFVDYDAQEAIFQQAHPQPGTQDAYRAQVGCLAAKLKFFSNGTIEITSACGQKTAAEIQSAFNARKINFEAAQGVSGELISYGIQQNGSVLFFVRNVNQSIGSSGLYYDLRFDGNYMIWYLRNDTGSKRITWVKHCTTC